MVSREEFFKGTGTAKPADEYEIEVWPCCMRVVEIYRTCQLSFVGMSGTCIGLSAAEIHTALSLHGVPRKRWPAMAEDLTVMGNAAAEYYAEQAKKDSKG